MNLMSLVLNMRTSAAAVAEADQVCDLSGEEALLLQCLPQGF